MPAVVPFHHSQIFGFCPQKFTSWSRMAPWNSPIKFHLSFKPQKAGRMGRQEEWASWVSKHPDVVSRSTVWCSLTSHWPGLSAVATSSCKRGWEAPFCCVFYLRVLVHFNISLLILRKSWGGVTILHSIYCCAFQKNLLATCFKSCPPPGCPLPLRMNSSYPSHKRFPDIYPQRWKVEEVYLWYLCPDFVYLCSTFWVLPRNLVMPFPRPML